MGGDDLLSSWPNATLRLGILMLVLYPRPSSRRPSHRQRPIVKSFLHHIACNGEAPAYRKTLHFPDFTAVTASNYSPSWCFPGVHINPVTTTACAE